MQAGGGQKVRVVLHAIQILDSKEFGKKRGQFRFKARVTSSDGGQETITEFPKEGVYHLSAEPGHNRARVDLPIFEGVVEDDLVVELAGEEQDTVTSHDSLTRYRRTFSGPPSEWADFYGPGEDHPDTDPENMPDWRVWYKIEIL